MPHTMFRRLLDEVLNSKLGTLLVLSAILFLHTALRAETSFADSLHQKARVPKVPANRSTKDSATTPKLMGTVVVTGTRNEVLLKDSPVRVEVIDNSRIRSTPATNLGMILQEQTGVGMSSGLHSGAQIMGMNADYTQILIDGQPLIGRVAGVIDLSRIAVANVRQVEVVKGPMSSLYGSEALAGVINLVTQRPAPGWSSRLTLQYLQKQGFQSSVNVGFSEDDLDCSFFADMKSSPAFELHSDSVTIPYSGFNDLTLQSRVKYYFSPKWSATANARYFASQSVGSFVESYFGQIASNKGSVDQRDAGLTTTVDWISGKAHLVGSLYLSGFSEQYHFDVVQGSGANLDDFRRSLVRPSLQYDVLWNEKNRFTLGTEFSLDRLTGTRYPSEPFYRTFVAYLQWEGNPTSWISYALSTRFDANNEYGNNVSPKLSTLVKVTDDWGLRFSAGTGFKAPDFRQLYVVFRNNLQGAGYVLEGARLLGMDLDAERSLSFESSLYWNGLRQVVFGRPTIVSMELRVFHNSLRNMIEYYLHHLDGSMAVYSYHNLSRIRTQGLESTIRAAVSLSSSDSLRLSVGYQYLDAADLDVLDAIATDQAGTVDSKTGSFIALTNSTYGGLWFRSRHLMNVRCDYSTSDGWSANLRADYVGRFGDQALDKNGTVLGNKATTVPDRDDEYASGYWNLKFSLSKEILVGPNVVGLSRLHVGLGVINLLDALNLRSVPTLLGRQYYAQISCDL